MLSSFLSFFIWLILARLKGLVHCSNPQLSGNDLSYDVKVLEGTLLAKGGACALLIDIIGMPRTPYSSQVPHGAASAGATGRISPSTRTSIDAIA
jgi:hypothetical protein